jgi:hypothetical protein
LQIILDVSGFGIDIAGATIFLHGQIDRTIDAFRNASAEVFVIAKRR